MSLHPLKQVFVAIFLLSVLVSGAGLRAAENETLYQKMKREQGHMHESEQEKSQHKPALPVSEPEISAPVEAPAVMVLPPSSLEAPPIQDSIQETRPARPLDWPPERFMDPVPADEYEQESGVKRSTTFTAAKAAREDAKVLEEISADGAAHKLDQRVYEGYILGAGDKLKITVFGEESLSGNFTVNDAGQISYPLIGEVDVKNLNVLEVKEAITGRLQQGYLKDPNIAIEVLEFRPFYITGEIRSPGGYSYVADMSVMNAIILAGGFTFRAEQDEVEILRNTASGTLMLKDVETDQKVLPGDIILVKERFF